MYRTDASLSLCVCLALLARCVYRRDGSISKRPAGVQMFYGWSAWIACQCSEDYCLPVFSFLSPMSDFPFGCERIEREGEVELPDRAVAVKNGVRRFIPEGRERERVGRDADAQMCCKGGALRKNRKSAHSSSPSNLHSHRNRFSLPPLIFVLPFRNPHPPNFLFVCCRCVNFVCLDGQNLFKLKCFI